MVAATHISGEVSRWLEASGMANSNTLFLAALVSVYLTYSIHSNIAW